MLVGNAGFSWVKSESGLQRFHSNSNKFSLLFVTDLVDKRWKVTVTKTLRCVANTRI